MPVLFSFVLKDFAVVGGLGESHTFFVLPLFLQFAQAVEGLFEGAQFALLADGERGEDLDVVAEGIGDGEGGVDVGGAGIETLAE